MIFFLDFETFSYADLKEVGSFRYTEEPTTEALCYALAVDDGPISLCIPDMEGIIRFPNDVPDDVIFVAHNIEFERNILRNKFGIDIPLERWRDTAAMAQRMSLPRKLLDLAKFFGLDVAAKKEANTGRKEDSVCRPRKPTKGNPDTRWTPLTARDRFDLLYKRVVQDVDLLRTIYYRLLPLEEKERRIWNLTLRMNERGVRVDLDSIPAARAVLQADSAPLVQEFTALTGCNYRSPVKVAKMLGMDNVRKSTVRKELRKPGIDPRKHRALTILQGILKASPAKLDAMESRAHADSRVRGSFLYCGAERTARWSSSGVQFQNFKRGLGAETDTAFAALLAGVLDLVFDGAPRPPPDPPLTPTATIAEMLRGFILGPFLVGDLAQIEARAIAWLSGDEEQLTLFRNKGDPYCAMAAEIYGVPVTKKEKDRRFMGKQAELGCGYGLGWAGFIRMLDEIYDVLVDEAFAKMVVTAYRRRHPKIVKFWERVNEGLVYVVAKAAPRVRVTRNLFMGVIDHKGMRYAYIELPSGRKLYYANPELRSTAKGPCVAYFGRDRFSKGWTQIRTYGGKIAENITQAVSRDVIAEAMLRLEDAGEVLDMTVHDEVVAEQDGNRSLSDYKRIMEIVPTWAEGLPIEVDVFETFRYRK